MILLSLSKNIKEKAFKYNSETKPFAHIVIAGRVRDLMLR